MATSTRPRPGQAAKDAVTKRILPHARKNWPGTEVLARHSGAFCYVTIAPRARTRRRRLLPAGAGQEREPFPALRLR